MKKVIAASLFFLSAAAISAEVSVSAVRDFNLDKNGHRVSATVGGVGLSATHINGSYNRYAVGKDFSVLKVAGVGISASGNLAYVDPDRGADGYGVVVGAKASTPLAKNVELVTGVERFVGQKRVERFDGTVATVGVNIKF